jgi:hypothetical protein
MKQLLITAFAAAAAASVYGQGILYVNNTGNTGVYGGAGGSASNPTYSAAVTQNGLIFTTDTTEQAGNFPGQGGAAGSTLIGEDFSWALYGGTTSSGLTLLGSQTGSAIVGDNANWGQVADLADLFTVAGSTTGSTVYLELYVWEGSTYSTYAAASAAGDYVGDSGVFQNTTGGGGSPGSYLTGLPDLNLAVTSVPEPGTLALAALGGASLLLFRRKK